MRDFIELVLLKDEDSSAKIYDIDSAIKESKIAVVLGAPGSGKSSLLKLFENKRYSIDELSTMIVESIINHKYRRC